MVVSPGNGERSPRICMPTWRRFSKRVYQCGLYEAQDVLDETGDVDLIELVPRTRGFPLWDRWHRRFLYHDFSRMAVEVNPGLEPVRLTRDYDLFIASCQNYEEVLYLSAIEGWRDRCRVAICLIEEMWAASLPTYRPWLHALRNFDFVFTCSSGSTAAISAAVGRPCHSFAGGVDTLRFTPFPSAPPRTVDFYSIGRRSEGLHAALLNVAARENRFFIHDTMRAADTEVFDPRQHRQLLANIAKRSRWFLVAPAKMNQPHETQGQVEIGFRYFEGVAAGCLMLGSAPESELFQRLFDWPDAVVEVRGDGLDAASVLERFESDPSRMAALSRTNAAQALLRHDWIYRWKDILGVIGMEVSEGLLARERRLQSLAMTAEPMLV